MDPTDVELQILESIHRNERSLHQRDLARIAGLSLGLTNALLKRLARKGWLSIRKINNRNIHYLATPAGLEMIAQRSYRFLKRTVGNVVRYRDAIGLIIDAAARRGARGIALSEASDLDFIVEHLCAQRGLAYRRLGAGEGATPPQEWYTLHSEEIVPPLERNREEEGMTAYLREVLGRAAQDPGRGGEA